VLKTEIAHLFKYSSHVAITPHAQVINAYWTVYMQQLAEYFHSNNNKHFKRQKISIWLTFICSDGFCLFFKFFLLVS